MNVQPSAEIMSVSKPYLSPGSSSELHTWSGRSLASGRNDRRAFRPIRVEGLAAGRSVAPRRRSSREWAPGGTRRAGVGEEEEGEGQVVEPVGLPWGARSLAGGAVKVSEAH